MGKIIREELSRKIIGAVTEVVVDPKVVTCLTETHIAQMIGYLNITGLDLAILLNFKNSRLERKRVLHQREAGDEHPSDLHA
jgi:GxxExxY protein